MRSLRSAAGLLLNVTDAETFSPVLIALGFAAARTIDPADQAALGLGNLAITVAIARGPGVLRALVVTVSPNGVPIRDVVSTVAERLARRAPHLLWLLGVISPAKHLALAAWSADRVPPRTAALVIDRARVLDSDADTFRMLEAAATLAPGGDGTLVHARWIDILGREALGSRFYRGIERAVATLGATSVEREIALVYTCRLLFLAFLESKGWLDGDRAFLARTFSTCVAGTGGVHDRVLRPLFFGTLNTPPSRRAPRALAFGRIPFLNGGLFTPTPAERRGRHVRFSDAALGVLFDELLPHYRFRAREGSADWSESAVDPAMLGATFESLMARAERRATGCFYTPRSLVETTTASTLAHLLSGPELSPAEAHALIAGGTVDPALAPILRSRLETIRILDPACGSGAFLVHMLEMLADLAGRLGDPRPVAERRRGILTRSIYGVDINPIAVWLCELRLWLSVVVESDESEALPNLDRNVRVGDSLGGDSASAAAVRLPRRYASAHGARKRALQRALDRTERSLAITRAKRALDGIRLQRIDLIAASRGRDLFGGRIEAKRQLHALRKESRERRQEIRTLEQGGALPFSYAVHFAHVGAFDAIIGNPPWVRLHNIPVATRERLRSRFRTFRDAAWLSGARLARAGRGFAAQVDLSALFVERALSLCRQGGVIALIVPAKLFRALAGGGVREMLLRETTPLSLEDWSNAEPEFDAAAYPALLVARRGHTQAQMRLAVHQRQGSQRRWVAPAGTLSFDTTPGSPWVIVPPAVRAAFDAVSRAGTPLAYSRFGPPTLGVKTGCNAAFVVTPEEIEEPFAIVRGRDDRGGTRRGLIESSLLRPLIRGDTLGAWIVPEKIASGRECLIWTHGVEQLPDHAAEWLEPWRRRLGARSDAGHAAWWSVFRTDGAIARTPRVVWGDLGRTPRAAVLSAGSACIALNSCYLARCPDLTDALALAALLNGPLAAAWLNAIAEPARGSWHRYLGWTVGLLPIPRDWHRARTRLACLAERGQSVTSGELWDAAVDVYGLSTAAVAPLAAWILGPTR